VSELEYYTFVETAVFTKQVDSKASLDVLYAIQNDLIADPKRGDVMQGTAESACRRPTGRQRQARQLSLFILVP